MLLLGELLHQPLFSWAAIGSFLTCLADSAGSNRSRIASMGGFALLSTGGGMLAAWAAGSGIWAGTLAIMLCAGLAGFSRIYGSATGLMTMLAAGVCAIMADTSGAVWPLWQTHFGFYLAGCVWATLLGLTVWRIHPFSPGRKAVARVYKSLAEFAQMSVGNEAVVPAEIDELTHLAALSRKHVRDDIALAGKLLAALPAERSEARALHEKLLIRLARSKVIYICLINIIDLRLSRHAQRADCVRADRIVAAIALILKAMQRDTKDPAEADGDFLLMANRIRRLASRVHPQVFPANAGAPAHAQFTDIAAAPSRSAKHFSDTLKDLWQTAELHWSARSMEFWHGWRCAVAAGATYLLVHWLKMPFGYWATMATMLIMQPSISDSWLRSMDRAGGSVVGGLLTVVLTVVLAYFVQSQWVLVLLVFPMVLATLATRSVSYGLYATFLTPTFALVADISAGGSDELSNAFMRMGNNVIGAIVALLATYFLWPRREKNTLPRKLSDTIIANLRYLRDALSHTEVDVEAIHSRRRDACVVNMEASLLLQRMQRENSLSDYDIQTATTVLALSRKLASDTTHIWCNPPPPAEFPQFIAWLNEMTALFDSDRAAADAYQVMTRCPRLMMSESQADAVEKINLLVTTLYPSDRQL